MVNFQNQYVRFKQSKGKKHFYWFQPRQIKVLDLFFSDGAGGAKIFFPYSGTDKVRIHVSAGLMILICSHKITSNWNKYSPFIDWEMRLRDRYDVFPLPANQRCAGSISALLVSHTEITLTNQELWSWIFFERFWEKKRHPSLWGHLWTVNVTSQWSAGRSQLSTATDTLLPCSPVTHTSCDSCHQQPFASHVSAGSNAAVS